MNRIYYISLIIIHLSFGAITNQLYAQTGNEINVSLTITPPYSPYFEDYINFEGAILILQNNTAQTQEIKLKGMIEGDNGLYARTRDDYQPLQPIVLGPYESVNYLSSSPVFDFMSMHNLETNISTQTQNESWRLGVLPEGNYSICIQAFSFLSGLELSPPEPGGCTIIPITYPQPPMIITPQCETPVEDLMPVFSWTPVVGNITQSNILYDLYILKLQPSFQGNTDPYQAMELAVDYNAGNPLVIRDLQITNYQYSPGDPPLIPNANYAFQVIARDANDLLIFENEGKSDVCTFTWIESTTIETGPTNTFITVDDVQLPVNLVAMTSLSGRLYYKFTPIYTGLMPLHSFSNVAQNTNNYFSSGSSSTPQVFIDNSNLFSSIPSAPYPDGSQYFDHDLINTSSFDEPLSWTSIRLVTRYIHMEHMIHKTTNWINSGSNTIAVPQDNGKVLSLTSTDGEGNYNFDFLQSVTGPVGNDLFRIITLEVVSPYFYSPDIKILSLPGDNLQLPDQAALVRTYDLNVNVKRDDTPDQIGGTGEPIAGVDINIEGNYFFCDPIPNKQIIVQQSPDPIMTNSDIDETKTTDVDGWVSFSGLVRHNASELLDRLGVNASTQNSYQGKQLGLDNSVLGTNQSGYVGKPVFKFYPSGSTFDPQQAFTEFDFDFPKFNSDREVEEFALYLEMEPESPQIFGRVLFDAVPLEGVSVSLWAGDLGLGTKFSNSDGYFLFDTVVAGPSLELRFSKPGFPGGIKHIGIMQMGQYKYYEHNMIYPGDVFGYVQNESGDAIIADVKFGEGDYSPYIFTAMITKSELQTVGTTTGTETIKVSVQKARFQCPAYEGEQIPLEILPRSDKYFSHTFFLDIDDLDKNVPKDIGEFTMFEKLHRIRFRVLMELPNSMLGYVAVPDATVEIQEQNLSQITDEAGEVYFKYASPASNFWVKVTPPADSDLTPYFDKRKLPVTKQDSIHTIILKKGYSINGVVTAGPDSIPLPDARVFIKSDIHNGQNFVPLIQTFTNSDGTFELKGIPSDPTLHSIYAVKSSEDIAYVGDSELVSENTVSPIYLNLDILDGINLSEIWKLPVEIEDLYFEENKMHLSGAFFNIPDNTNFQKTEADLRLSFYNLPVINSDKKDSNGNYYLEPVENNIKLGLLSMPVMIQNHFFGEVLSHTSLPQSSNSNDLLIKVLKDQAGSGFIKGIAEMDLTSFKFSYDYNAAINLADQNLDFKIQIYTANPQLFPHQSYNVGKATSNGLIDLEYSVHEFDATADRHSSIVFEDTVKLNTILHTNVPNCIPADLKIEAGFIKIVLDDILPMFGGDELSFSLEKWDVISLDTWVYDKNHGGIVIPSARINTHVIDLEVEDLLIKPDDLKLDNSNLSGNISLAGVTYVNLLPGTKTIFHYDSSCSSDMKAHWRFSVMPLSQNSDSPVGEIVGLPGMKQSDRIDVGKFSLFSNDESQMGQFDQTITFYDVFDLRLDGNALSTYPNSFELHGTYDLDIPNLTSDYPAILQFSKPEQEIIMNLLPPYLEFETIGNVKFKADQTQDAFNFSNGLFEALGDITITDNEIDIILRGKLTRSLTEIKVDIIQVNDANQLIAFGGHPDKYLEIIRGKMEVVGVQWEKLWFEGATIGLGEGVKDPYKNLLLFVAHGDVNVDNGAVEVTGVSTPFGSISITFDFLNMSLHGSLSINTPIATGYCTFKKGCGELQIDGDGFYFGLGLTIHILSIPLDIDAAVIVGYYPTFDQHLQDLLNEYSYRDQMPTVFNGGVEGFLFSLTINLINVHEGIDLGIAEFSLDASIGANYIVYATFTDPPAFGMELLIFAALNIELSFLCIDLGISIAAELLVGGVFVDGEIDLIGCGYLMVGIYYDVCELVSDCLQESVRMDLRWGTSTGGDLDADITLGGSSCSGNSGFNSDHTPCN